MVDLIQQRVVSAISASVELSAITILKAEAGMAPLPTIKSALARSNSNFYITDGDWRTGGYLAGLQALIDAELRWAKENRPKLVEAAQQSLKRLFPLLNSDAFTVPKDLTNTSSKEERTRFYHHEYQNKLLVGLAEFLINCARQLNERHIIVIDRAAALSGSAKNLIKLLVRLDDDARLFRFVLIDYEQRLYFPDASEVHFGRYSSQELGPTFDPDLPAEKHRQIYEASGGNPLIAEALSKCTAAGLPVVGYLDPTATVDLYLASLNTGERHSLLKSYIESDCTTPDLIAQRNYATFEPATADHLHEQLHHACLERYLAGKAPLVMLHALSVRDKYKRLELLAEPSQILQSIGLYDLWFGYFGEIFADAALRTYGSGDASVNAAFINAAFVLYSLGCGRVSVPYLDEFYKTFPKSRYTPTVLYAQSMTYGRYQQPVNLTLAEEYALRNLETIERDFRGHNKYDYIKVFAENAYAYIKAKQQKYDEALALCAQGLGKMLKAYGDERFKLHQSILIYNTSQVYELIDELPRAEKQLREAIAYDPYYGEYHNDLGNLLSKVAGREAEALEAYARAIELCPPYYEAHLNRAALHSRMGDAAGALADLDRTLVIKPNEWRAHFEKGNILMRQDRPKAALESYLAAAEISPKNPDLQSNLGLAYSELGKTHESIAHYVRALELNPRHALTHNNLAIEYFNEGRPDISLNHATVAVEIGGDPDYLLTREHIEKSLQADLASRQDRASASSAKPM
ncbi:tetratricopeptide repeat protein [Bradyrhizobium pachyrhizi]|uniref:Tetratricopeptide repeat protein n=1 Tax=Bradyrhizobium pachyrhizi TaxID=280333 RepID=A0A844T3G8_9BRAD|nr:tetratricopeptide repeat protein [Bradyrhizobium pachyrhizi]MVT70949.1 tetratricopeptide repeat protein [Bradyrhizobium pachyrhizi]